MPKLTYDPEKPLRLTHFTPENRACWHWCFMQPVLTLSGPQRTITGEVVMVDPPITAWSGAGFPPFATRDDAVTYAHEHGLQFIGE